MSETALCNQCICLCVHTLGQHGAAPPPHQSLAGPPRTIQSLQSRAEVVASGFFSFFFFLSTKESKESNEEYANFFFPFPLKVQAGSVDLDGTGRTSEGLWEGLE